MKPHFQSIKWFRIVIKGTLFKKRKGETFHGEVK